MPYVRWLGVLGVVWFLSGCASTVSPGGDGGDGGQGGDGGAMSDVAQSDGGGHGDGGLACVMPDGTSCPAGTTCPIQGDRCGNTCACPATGGQPLCTQRDCPIFDAGGTDGGAVDAGALCRTGADCGPNQVCVFEPGCPPAGAVGTCQEVLACIVPNPYCGCDGQTYQSCQSDHPLSHVGWCETPNEDGGAPMRLCRSNGECLTGEFCDFEGEGCNNPGVCRTQDYCSLPVAPTYCGCDGVTFNESSNCTHQAYLHTGACGADCTGAALGPGGQCLGPTDGPMPVECCYGYDCDQRHAACDSLPPQCAPGSTAAVSTFACWVGCVPDSHCAAIACTASGDCPPGWTCASDGQCAPPQ